MIGAAEPFVIAVLMGLEPPPDMLAAINEVVPHAEVAWTRYTRADDLAELDEATAAVWARANAIIAMELPPDLETRMPHLSLVQSASAGYDSYDLGALAVQGVRVASASGVAAASIAEFVMARLLQVWKRLPEFDRQRETRTWKSHYGRELTGMTVGIAGLGAIGRAVAWRARAFDMTVLATRASARSGDTDPDVDEIFPASDLDAMLGRCDAVVASLPTNDSTVDLFDNGRFAAMREGAVFCNVGRGVHVVESALIDALRTGHLRAAAIDVTRVEPLPADDPLWAAPNLLLSPHSSISLDRYTDNLAALFVENLRRFVGGERLRNEIDLTRR